ncbi:hypothetical protein ALQ64_200044 [Pseudomonas cannabina]|uniref:Uncharacterized protein n=1 Tax=Pseudomonas cannabina TaxID=86840 RepID=A0A3M3KKJ3_PSECA|nr:hypothetical protein ALQ64_200044 [Pseudomonas cannabina]
MRRSKKIDSTCFDAHPKPADAGFRSSANSSAFDQSDQLPRMIICATDILKKR